MKQPQSLLLALVFALPFAVPAAEAVEVDGIAARVGSESILKSEVAEELRRSGGDPSRFNEVRSEMIDRKLILKAAADSKMTMQDWVVESRIREIIDRAFGGDRNKLMDQLQRQKVSYPEWRQRMQDDMVVSAMRWNTVDRNVVASPAAMREEYRRHPERYTVGRRVSVSVILLKPEDAERRGEIAAKLREEPFEDVARRYSADSHAAAGGLWKDVDPAEVFRPEVVEEIGKMPKGTLSHWIDLDGWSFLLRKESDDEAKTRSFAEAYDDIEENVRVEQAKRLYDEWVARLRASAYIKVYP